MAFKLLLAGWVLGLLAAMVAYLALGFTPVFALAVWSAAGTATILVAGWSVALDTAADSGDHTDAHCFA